MINIQLLNIIITNNKIARYDTLHTCNNIKNNKKKL